MAGILFYWLLTDDQIMEAVNSSAKKKVGRWIIGLGHYIYVPLTAIALIAGAILGGIG